MKGDYSDIPPEEVRQMPFWKQLCFKAQGWNHSFDPQGVDEWCDTLCVFNRDLPVIADVIKHAQELHGCQ